jgi:hypothetical protein
MAITNAQQYKQLVNPPLDGKRPGYRGDAAYRSRSAQSSPSAGGQGNVGSKASFGGSDKSSNESFKSFDGGGGDNPSDAPPSKEVIDRQRKNYQNQFTSKGIAPPGPNRKERQRALNYLNKNMLINYNRFGKYYDPSKFGITKTGYPNFGFPNFYEGIAAALKAGATLDEILENENMIPIGKSGTSFEMNPIPDLDIDSIRELAATQTTLQGAPLTGYQANALESLRETINKRDNFLETGDTSDIFPDPNTPNPDDGPEEMDPCLGPNPPAYCATRNTDPTTPPPRQILTSRIIGSQFEPTMFAAYGGRAGMMDGGMMDDDPTGGIMDLESGRQMYFLGKLVKKAGRALKKVAKSPFGKAAILGGMAYFGGGGGLPGFLGGKGIGGFSTKTLFSKANPLLFTDGKFSIAKGLGLSALLPFLFPEEENKFDIEEYYRQGKIANVPLNMRIAGSDFYAADGGLMRAGYQEGGDAEPVAKKTMPLIDMDGMEKDYRETGGFVEMGRMERADDVPARLSKNEFVFTADAVRNAGDGDIDKGAEVMYNMMKNLEDGGDVSEESQGLEGARNMFQTSQRLGEVL